MTDAYRSRRGCAGAVFFLSWGGSRGLGSGVDKNLAALVIKESDGRLYSITKCYIRVLQEVSQVSGDKCGDLVGQVLRIHASTRDF